MSGLKNSPFGKRLRATQQDPDEEGPRRSRPRTNPVFGVAPVSTPSLDSSRPTTSESGGPDSPTELHRPNKDYGDRFVPSRDAGDLRTSYNLMEDGPSTPSRNRVIPTESDAAKEQANAIFTTILHTEVTPPSPRRPVSPPTATVLLQLSSGSNPSTPTRRLDMPTDEAYSMSPVREESRQILESPRRRLRNVSKTPYRVLDAPELADDFYLNLVDWSAQMYLASVLKGSTLAVGTVAGRLHIYDAQTLQLQRTYQQAHTQRIGALAWNSHVLSSGSRDRLVHHRDVRESDGAAQGGLLASGGNDNKVCIWDLRSSRRPSTRSGAGNAEDGGISTSVTTSLHSGDSPLWKFHEHTAAVKALAWDPHVAGVLATGGGTQDKHIRFWNMQFGNMLSELDTGSQVCNLTWSLTSHEIVSTHGYSSAAAQNQICIWKYPSLDMVASLTGHTSRVLYLAMSPDGETIVTGAGDETLRFWNAFPKREGGEARRESRLDYGRLIR
ncbi:WD40 repeat-like protein [Russula brevipes]|nr:WD40 repeat-like protein [Russula brevipes]